MWQNPRAAADLLTFIEEILNGNFHFLCSVKVLSVFSFYLRWFYYRELSVVRSSHWRCFVKKCVLENFANFAGKHLCWSLLLIRLQSLQQGCFSVKLAKFLRTLILKAFANDCFWLVLYDESIGLKLVDMFNSFMTEVPMI